MCAGLMLDDKCSALRITMLCNMLCLQDARARALIQQPDLQDGEGLKEGCLALLSQATPLEEQALLGTAPHCLHQSLPIIHVHIDTAAVASITLLSLYVCWAPAILQSSRRHSQIHAGDAISVCACNTCHKMSLTAMHH